MNKDVLTSIQTGTQKEQKKQIDTTKKVKEKEGKSCDNCENILSGQGKKIQEKVRKKVQKHMEERTIPNEY